MWIVYTRETGKHSAWTTKAGARKQVEVLRDHGYRDAYTEKDETVSCENGHYYV